MLSGSGTISGQNRHNVPVTSGVRARRGFQLVAVSALAALTLTGCGQGTAKPEVTPTTAAPSSNVVVPAGVKLTKAGTTLGFGEQATVAYEPNTERRSVLQLSVDSVTRGTIADFSAYRMDDRTKASSVYYVQATLKNIGEGNLGGSAIPLLAQDSKDTLIQPSTFTNDFTKCPSRPLPADFAAGAELKSCLVYLVPEAGELTDMSFRPRQATKPILWRGTIADAPAKPGKKKVGS